MTVRYIPEEVSRALISHELAAEATAAAYLAAAGTDGTTFPVVRGHGSQLANRFSIKSACTDELAGLKIGSYWSSNALRGDPPHNSTILLFDQASGRIDALIEASVANAYRTAAGDAHAVMHLARTDAERLAVFGAGHQARFECEAVLRARPRIRKISVVNRSHERARGLAERLADLAEVSVCGAEEACRNADVIVTVTASREPLFDSAWVAPGTHISCMGSDAHGKQELSPALLQRADLYCDFLPQSIDIGEYQHIANAIEQPWRRPINLGDVLAGRALGRLSPESITVFDSSGLALQDLYLARSLLREAEGRQLVSVLRR